jgi:plasmid stabilization system protein ParE
MKIAWTKKAEKQLNQIFKYIGDDSPYYAYRTTQNIIERAENITQNHRKEERFQNINERIFVKFFTIPTE